MLFNHKYPYTDFHELNLDWILCKMRELDSTLTEFTTLNKLQWCGAWDISKSYSAWSLVDDGNGNGYVSTGPVPAGVQLTDTNYWQKVANYSALYSAFEQRIDLLEDGEAEIKTDLNSEIEARKEADASLQNSIDSVSDAISEVSENLNAAIKRLPTNLGVNVVKSEHADTWDSALNDYGMQGACYDSKREYIYIGVSKDDTDTKIVVLNKNFEYVKTMSISSGGHMNDLDYRNDTDEIWIACNLGSYVNVYNASDFTFKRKVSFDSLTDHWPISITHDENNNMFIAFYWDNNDVRLYKTDSNGNNPVLIGNFYDSNWSTFNNYSGVSTSGGYTIYTGMQYQNGYIYIVEEYAEYTPRWIPCRLLAFDAEHGEFKTAVDYLVPKYEEPENLFLIGDDLYIGGSQFDWTSDKSTIYNFKLVKETEVVHSPTNIQLDWAASLTHDNTRAFNLPQMPSGKFLVIVTSDQLVYESGRTIFADLQLPSGAVKQQLSPTQYLNPTFNMVGYYNATDPWTLALAANAFTTSDFTLNFHIKLIELSGYVPYGEATA